MTDLAEIFKMSPPSISKSLDVTSHLLPSRPTHFESSRLSSRTGRDGGRDLSFSVQPSASAKRVITYSNMHEEVDWFKKKYRLEGVAKIALIVCIALGAISIGYFKTSIGLGIIFVSALALGLKHNIFGSGKIEPWAFASLIFSIFVLCNQIFLFFLHALNQHFANTLHASYFSLLPSLHISLLLILVLLNGPLIMPTPHRSITQNLLSIPSDLLFSLHQLYKIKYIIFQLYSLTLLLTIAVTFTFFSLKQELFMTFYPIVFFAQLFAFAWSYMLLCILLVCFSEVVSSLMVKIHYNERNEFTKIPFMLELLRVTPSDSKKARKDSFSITVANVFSFNREEEKLYNLPREKAEVMYSHSMKWITDLLAFNYSALNTKINTSKFYHKFSDIFEEFAEQELQRCCINLFELTQMLRRYKVMKDLKKTLKEDLFYWFRLKMMRVSIWLFSVECIRYFNLSEQVIEIMVGSRCREWKNLSGIRVSLQEMQSMNQKLSEDFNLNEIIRNKMDEYANKCQRALEVIDK